MAAATITPRAISGASMRWIICHMRKLSRLSREIASAMQPTTIDPLSEPSMRESPAPVVVVSPIVAGHAIKGPAAKMMAELGLEVSALEVARHYTRRYPGLMDRFVIDDSDATMAGAIRELGVEVAVTGTVMKSRADKQALARFALQL